MISILSATRDEISIFLKELKGLNEQKTQYDEIIEGTFLDISIVIAISGIGIKRARAATEKVIKKFKPKFIVSAGYAGALNPRLKTGDLILADWVMSLKLGHRKNFDNTLPYIPFNYLKGGILTENRFINDQKEKLDLHLNTSAQIVDMETWGVVETADKHNVRVLSVRTISDTTRERLPRMERLYSKNSEFDLRKSMAYFKENPLQITNFIKFRFLNMEKAKIRLNSFLTILVPILNKL